MAGSISTKAITENSGEWAEMESLIISQPEKCHCMEWRKSGYGETSLLQESAKENDYISKSRRDITNFLLGHKQKLRNRLRAQEDSSAQPGERWLRDSPTAASSRAPAPRSSCCCWALGWGRCCQDSPRQGGRYGGESGPHARLNRELAALTRPPNHLRVWNRIARRAGQTRLPSPVFFCQVPTRRVVSPSPLILRGGLYTLDCRGCKTDSERWGPELEAWGGGVQGSDASTGLSGTQAHVLSTSLGWVSVLWERVDGLRFSSLQSYNRSSDSPPVSVHLSSFPSFGILWLEEGLWRIPWNYTQNSVWVHVLVFFFFFCGKRACGFCWFSEGSMTQGYGLGCFRHYSVWCSPITDEEMGFLNLISCSQLLLLVLEREQPSPRSSATRSFRYCPCAVGASWRGQAAGWGASPAVFREKRRVPKEGRAGPSPKVSWTVSVLYMNWGHVRRVDRRMTPDNPQNDSFLFFLRLDRFGETTWLSQICTLNPGPNSFQAFLKLRIWIDERR